MIIRITRTSFYIVFYDKWIVIWFVLINLCFNNFNEKTWWTSEILGENSWQLLFVLMRRSAWLCRQCLKKNSSTTNIKFFQEFSPRISEVLQVFSLKLLKLRLTTIKFWIGNFCLGIFVLKILWVFILIIKLHACCLKVKINYKNTLCKTSSSKFTTFWKI